VVEDEGEAAGSMTFAPGIPLGVDLDTPEGRRLYVDFVNSRCTGGRLVLIDGHAGATVVDFEAARTRRATEQMMRSRATRERPL
jgi:hypothetical protein